MARRTAVFPKAHGSVSLLSDSNSMFLVAADGGLAGDVKLCSEFWIIKQKFGYFRFLFFFMINVANDPKLKGEEIRKRN